MNRRNVFVTVGTTEFDDLIKTVTHHDVLKALLAAGYSKLTIQKGKGEFTPKEGISNGVDIEVFAYKPSLVSNYQNADLIISHAGACSSFEALLMEKPLIMVVNNRLMNNHQLELAEALAAEGVCQWCIPDKLCATIQSFTALRLSKYKPGQPKEIAKYIDSTFILPCKVD